jgi:sortase (surface protein transpeptidase)
VELQPGDRLVSLCTCNDSQVNARYMLVGRLVELYEE